MIRIAHVSDLHFGAADPAAIAALGAALSESEPNAVIVTGDVTQFGRRREFVDAAAFLRGVEPPLMVIPGNHDAPVFAPLLRIAAPWRRFRRILRFETGAVLDLDGARIIGLNSARRASMHHDWSRGRLSRRQIEGAAAAAADAPDTALRVVALHHPVHTIHEHRSGQAVVSRAQHALDAFGDVRVDLVLTGHAHRANVAVRAAGTSSLVVASAGTASSTRTRGEAPSFNLIDGDRNGIDVQVLEYESGRYLRRATHSYVATGGGWSVGEDAGA